MSGGLLYAAAIGICAGVAAAFLFGNALFLAGTCLLFAAALLVVRKPLVLIAAIALAAAALCLARADIYLQNEAAQNLLQFVGEKTEVIGTVANDPERRDTSLHVYVEVSQIGGETANGKLLALLPRDAEIFYGDRVVVSGKIEAPETFVTDTGRLFDYPSYLRAHGASAIMRYAELSGREEGSVSILGALFSIKHIFTRSLERIFPEPEGSLLQGLLLGERRGLPQELTDAFITAGLIHVVVLSGYNISIVYEAVLRVLSIFPRAVGFSLAGGMMLLFVLMIGAGATAVRALIMGLIAVLARYFGRSALALRALALAASGMVLWNPTTLLFDPSFILSVLATFGLITLSPAVETKLTQFFAKIPQVRSIAASTIAVQIFVLPALLYMTGVLSFLALPANILVLPAVPFAMGFGFAAGLLGFIHPALALPAVISADALLKFMMFVATIAHSLPLSSAVMPEFPFWLAVLAYIPLTAFAIRMYTAEQNKLGGDSRRATTRE